MHSLSHQNLLQYLLQLCVDPKQFLFNSTSAFETMALCTAGSSDRNHITALKDEYSSIKNTLTCLLRASMYKHNGKVPQVITQCIQKTSKLSEVLGKET